MNGWMDGWIDGWMDGWMDGWLNFVLADYYNKLRLRLN
jgi:hypothetical protein